MIHLSPGRVDRPIQRLLLVEDNAGDARLLREMISEGGAHGVEWTHVETLAAAEKHLADGEVDLILLDLSLPDAQGLETLRRAKLAAPRIPVVVLSGLDDESLALEALHQGAEDYLVKGQISARELRRSMRHAVEREGLKEEVLAEKGSSRMAGELFQALVENVPDIIARLSIREDRLESRDTTTVVLRFSEVAYASATLAASSDFNTMIERVWPRRSCRSRAIRSRSAIVARCTAA